MSYYEEKHLTSVKRNRTRKNLKERIARYQENIRYWDERPSLDPEGISRRTCMAMLNADLKTLQNLQPC